MSIVIFLKGYKVTHDLCSIRCSLLLVVTLSIELFNSRHRMQQLIALWLLSASFAAVQCSYGHNKFLEAFWRLHNKLLATY